jgi:hypothetical protein
LKTASTTSAWLACRAAPGETWHNVNAALREALCGLPRGVTLDHLLAAAFGVDCTAFADPSVKPPAPAAAKPRGRPPKAKPADEPSALTGKKTRRRKRE